jgi:hypothetical protein
MGRIDHMTGMVDWDAFQRNLNKYLAMTKRTVVDEVSWKFRDVVYSLRQYHLATRSQTLAKIAAVKAAGRLGISKRTKDRFAAKKSKLLARYAKAQQKAQPGSTKRPRSAAATERALARVAKLQKQIGAINHNVMWEAEVKMRENAAGRAGAWGWKIKGRGFEEIAANDKAIKVEKANAAEFVWLQATNKRPMINEFSIENQIFIKAVTRVTQNLSARILKRFPNWENAK